ncbi:MAG: hypothetical protein WB791_00020 [Waddliaceae bacterium]
MSPFHHALEILKQDGGSNQEETSKALDKACEIAKNEYERALRDDDKPKV